MALVTNIAAAPTGGLYSTTSIAAFNRPANTTPYTGSRIVTDSTSVARALVFPGVGKSGLLRTVGLLTEDNYNVDLRAIIFSQEPTNVVDDGTLTMSDSDKNALVGIFTFSGSTDIGVGGIRWGAHKIEQNIPYATPDGNLYGLLFLTTSYTPTSAAYHQISLGLELDHI